MFPLCCRISMYGYITLVFHIYIDMTTRNNTHFTCKNWCGAFGEIFHINIKQIWNSLSDWCNVTKPMFRLLNCQTVIYRHTLNLSDMFFSYVGFSCRQVNIKSFYGPKGCSQIRWGEHSKHLFDFGVGKCKIRIFGV